MAYYGQATSQYGGNSNPASMLFGTGSSGSGSSSLDSAQAVAQILNAVLSARSTSDRFLDNGVSVEDAAEYIAENKLDLSDLSWKMNSAGQNVIALDENQWAYVQDIEFSTFVDDGNGYIDMGLDTVFEWDEEGNLIANTDRSWLGIEGRLVAFYHIDTTGDSSNYTITGRVPVYLNDEIADLIIVFDSENEDGYIAGATYEYKEGETEVIAKNLTELQPGDTIEFIADYYDYNGNYTDKFTLDDPLTVSGAMEDMLVSNLVIEDKPILISYVLTDIYGNSYYTEGLSE